MNQEWWAEAVRQAGEAARVLAELAGQAAPAPERLRAVGGELFAVRCDVALLGLDGLAIALGLAEEALLLCADGQLAWSRAQAPLASLAATMLRILPLLTPDLRGANAHADELALAMRAVEALLPSSVSASSEPTEAAPGAAADDRLWVPQVDADMIDPFLDESNERIEGLQQKLLALESSPGDRELVREIFRDLHTVKGSSAFVGLRPMNRLAHAAEDVVGQLRDGGRAPDRPTIDALLMALDGLRGILAVAMQAGRGGAQRQLVIDVAIEPLVARLRAPLIVASAPVVSGAEPSGHKATPGERQTLRVDFDKLDSLLNLVGELVLGKARLRTGLVSLGAVVREFDNSLRRGRSSRSPVDLDDLERYLRVYAALVGDLEDGATQLDQVAGDLRRQVMKLRMLPVGRVFTKYHRTVRELAHQLGKSARLEIVGADTELDKVLLEQIDEPLLHLVRNALDHGIESAETRKAAGKPPEGVLRLSAQHRGNQIVIEISDDGAGIDGHKLRNKAREKQLADEAELAAMDEREVLDLIFRPGFSTAARVTEVSGRGVGMDIVREIISRLSGVIELASEPGRGTTFTLKLPLTLAIIQVLLVRAAGEELALPLDVVTRTFSLFADEIHHVHDQEVFYLDERPIPLLSLARALGLPEAVREAESPVVLVRAGGESFGLLVDRLSAKREIVLKGLGELLRNVPCAAGSTLIGDRVVLVLDVAQVVQRGLKQAGAPRAPLTHVTAPTPGRGRPRVLLAEDSDVIREGLRRLYESQGCDVIAARDGGEALALAERDEHGFDLVSTDVMMPVLDGYELTRALRAHPRHRHVPIVMVTSRADAVDRVRGFDAGVDEYITKPLDAGELMRALGRHLPRRPGAS